MMKNAKEVIKTEGWRDLMLSGSHIVNQVVESLANASASANKPPRRTTPTLAGPATGRRWARENQWLHEWMVDHHHQNVHDDNAGEVVLAPQPPVNPEEEILPQFHIELQGNPGVQAADHIHED